MKTYNPKSVQVWCGGVRVDNEQSFSWDAPRVESEAKSDPYIQTYSHRALHILAPSPEEVELEDVAHALSLKTRYTGHCAFHYSVAQHCVLGAELLEKAHGPDFALAFLLHELGEVYLPDIASPLKPFVRIETEPGVTMGWKQLEHWHEVAILAALDLEVNSWLNLLHHPVIKAMDRSMLAAEALTLMPPLIPGWGGGAMEDPADIRIMEWEPRDAEIAWLGEYERLTRLVENEPL